MTQEPTIDQLTRQLAQAREQLAEAAQQQASIELEIEAIIAKQFGVRIADAKLAHDEAADLVDELTQALRDRAVQAFQESGVKRANSAVQVREFTTLTYDPDDAFTYCVRHLTTALNMDKRKFEKVAKVAELDFVTIEKEPRATIASDLSAWLPQEGEANDR